MFGAGLGRLKPSVLDEESGGSWAQGKTQRERLGGKMRGKVHQRSGGGSWVREVREQEEKD